jgi:predicted RNase H-like HicB family nuclease
LEVIYKAIIEKTGRSWGAYVPDLPGCIAVSSSRSDVELLIREAVEMHIELLRESGDPVPPPTATDGTIDVTAA